MTKCNGWTNWETWIVALWLVNDENTYHAATKTMDESAEDYENAQTLREYVEGLIPENIEGFCLDLIGGGLSEVNWIEIVRNFREE